MKRTVLASWALCACLLTSTAFSAVPERLHYSGKLDTANGAFTGTIDMAFALYDGLNATSSAWSETQSVTVQDGRFHVLLGDSTAITPADVDVTDLYLGVTVATDDEMVRVALSSVPYALRATEAANAATVGGQAPSEFAPTTHTHAQYLTLADLATYDDDKSDDLTLTTAFDGDVTGTYDTLAIAAGTIGGTEIADGSIKNQHVASNAAIAGTKISANFGNQTVTAGHLQLTTSGTGQSALYLRGHSGGNLPDFDGDSVVEKGVYSPSGASGTEQVRMSIRFRRGGSGNTAGSGGIRWGDFNKNDFYLHRPDATTLKLDYFDYDAVPQTQQTYWSIDTSGNMTLANALAVGGKVTSASTLGTDGGTTLTTKDYVDGNTLAGLTGCTPEAIARWDANDEQWKCGTDTDTNTTYTAGDGLDLTGTVFSAAFASGSNAGSATTVARSDHDHNDDYVQESDTDDWDKNKDDDLNTTTDYAGDVTGKYNALEIGAGKVGDTELSVNYAGSASKGGTANDSAKLNGQAGTYYTSRAGNLLHWVDDNASAWADQWTYIKNPAGDASILDTNTDCAGNIGCQLSDWVKEGDTATTFLNEHWVVYDNKGYIPIDTALTYYGRIWAKSDHAGSRIYVGYMAYDIDKVKLPGNPGANHGYWLAQGSVPGTSGTWYERHITGEGTERDQFPVGTKFIRPLIIANYKASQYSPGARTVFDGWYMGIVTPPADGTITGDHIGDDAVDSDTIADGVILNKHVNDAAAIAGTKIAPSFGNQHVSTTKTLSVGTTNADLALRIYGAGTSFGRGNDSNGAPIAHEWKLHSQGPTLPDFDGDAIADENDPDYPGITEKGVVVTTDNLTRETLRFRASGSSKSGSGGIRWGWYNYNDFLLHTMANGVLSLDFYEYNDAGTDTQTPVAVFNKDGRLGIGTAPTVDLDVLDTDGNADVHIARKEGAMIRLQAQSALGTMGTATEHNLGLLTNSSVRMTITSSGKVGIGKPDPAVALDIVGNARSTATVMADDGTTLTTKSYVDSYTLAGLQGCDDDAVAKWDDSASQWKCGVDEDNTYTGDGGVTISEENVISANFIPYNNNNAATWDDSELIGAIDRPARYDHTHLDIYTKTTDMVDWDQDASDDLTTATAFGGEVTGTSASMVVMVNYAGSESKGGPADDAKKLDGLDPSAFYSRGGNLVQWHDQSAEHWTFISGNNTFPVNFTDTTANTAWTVNPVEGTYLTGGADNRWLRYDGGGYIPIDTSRTYYGRIYAEAMDGLANGKFYAGYIAYDRNKNELDGNGGSYGYFIASSKSVPTTGAWYEGYITGEGTVSTTFPVGTRYIKPLVIINHDTLAMGVTFFDALYIGVVEPIQAGSIANSHINSSANIAGTKISANFGSQTVKTTGLVQGGDLKATDDLTVTDEVTVGDRVTTEQLTVNQKATVTDDLTVKGNLRIRRSYYEYFYDSDTSHNLGQHDVCFMTGMYVQGTENNEHVECRVYSADSGTPNSSGYGTPPGDQSNWWVSVDETSAAVNCWFLCLDFDTGD